MPLPLVHGLDEWQCGGLGDEQELEVKFISVSLKSIVFLYFRQLIPKMADFSFLVNPLEPRSYICPK